MKMDLSFGDGHITADLPDRSFVLPPDRTAQRPDPIADLEGAVNGVLDAPLGLDPIETLVKPGPRVTIAFDDGTCPCFGPYRRIVIEAVLGRLEGAGVPRSTVTLICANALHRKFRKEELATFIGEDLVKEFGERLYCHDAEDADGNWVDGRLIYDNYKGYGLLSCILVAVYTTISALSTRKYIPM